MKSVILVANSRYQRGTANSINVFRMVSAFASEGFKVRLIALRSSIIFKTVLWKETCDRYGDNPDIKRTFFWWPFQRCTEPVLALLSAFILPFVSRDTLVYTRICFVALLAVQLGFRVVFESHAPPKNSMREKIEHVLLTHRNSYVVVISNGLLNMYKTKGLPVDNMHIAPDAGRLIRNTSPRKEEFQGPCNNVGYIGSLYTGRGFRIIVSLAEKIPDRSFHVVGDLKTLPVSSDKLPQNILLKGAVTPDDAERVGKSFDAFLMPYQKEVRLGNGQDTSSWMSPMKMFEYMLAGRPVISSNLAVLREVLHDHVNALLVDADDVKAWVGALNQLDSPELRFQLALNAYNDASANYTWDIRVQRILKFINSGRREQATA